MKPVQTNEVQELIYQLVQETPVHRLDLLLATNEMIGRLEEEKQQKEQAIYYGVLDQLAQANIKPLDSEKESLKETNEQLKDLVKGMAQLL
ncbi:hypothetical protein [Priestia aryabhattai]